jgi:23S rRNA pseudouridine1911/1915/1917 synthase
MRVLFEILLEDEDLLVVNKPAGLVCHPTKTDEYSSLISRARLHLGKDAHPQLVNRLDRETSGVTLIAKTEPAARELRRIWENRLVKKQYLAIVHGDVRDEAGIIDVPLGKDEVSCVAIKDCVRADGTAARTRYEVERRFVGNSIQSSVFSIQTPENPCGTRFTLLNVWPETGRKHQIRIHLAHLGHPIVGDKLYGGDEDLYMALVENRLTEEQRARLILPHHALHAAEVRFVWREQERVFRAEPEAWFSAFLGASAEL